MSRARIADRSTLFLLVLVLLLGAARAQASGWGELDVRRQPVFEFTQKPQVTRHGDRATIAFTSKGFCDATVAIENDEGRIIRHLASGVLGKNAPSPFQKNSLRQKIVWDGKDDQGTYIDDMDAIIVRVSLGLRPRFERTLFWAPQRRLAAPGYLSLATPVVVPAPEGVYVYEGYNADHLRLFDHDGNYVRTIYPFPAEKLAQVKGLKWHTFPQDGKRFPLSWGISQNTLLTSARLAYGGRWPTGGSNAASAATAMAVHGDRIALASARLNRLGTDGSSGGMPLGGPVTSFRIIERTYLGSTGRPLQVGPRSAAISPDGKWFYLTGYYWRESWGTGGTRHRWLNAVTRLRLDKDAPLEVFAGHVKRGQGGTGDRSFRTPTSVACDRQGRVYVADYMNDRIQVYLPDGKSVRTIKAAKPAYITIDRRTKDLYVFSWLVGNSYIVGNMTVRVRPTLTRFSLSKEPRQIGKACPLPLIGHSSRWNQWDSLGGTQYRVALDPWATPPKVWVAGSHASWENAHTRIYELRPDKLVLRRNFGAETRRKVVWIRSPHFGRQRLYCNPQNGWVYAGEDHLPSNVHSVAIRDLVGIDPRTGQVRIVPLPFDAEDLAFGPQGHAYLRVANVIARYDTAVAPWREIPFDYGEQFDRMSYQGHRSTSVISGVTASGGTFVSGRFGGIAVSPKGHIAMTLDVRGKLPSRKDARQVHARDARPYTPRVYPGRAVQWVIHVWDKHGKVLYDDALPGMGICSGLHIDKDDNLYVLAAAQRLLAGKPYFNDASCTLIKARPKRAKVLSMGAAVPMGPHRPKRAADARRWRSGLGAAWIENAEWLYGGVGLDSHSIVAQIRACHCEATSRPALDYFARSFVPEINRYDVVVIDTNGNTVLRIGRYGNVDDGMPLHKKGGPPRPRSIGGDGGSKAAGAVSEGKLRRRSLGNDEVALAHGAHVAVDTDRRLFISDLGNARIVSVKLGYHATERIALKTVAADK